MLKKVLRNIYIYTHVYLGNLILGGFLIFCSFFIRRMSFYNRMITVWGKWALLALPGKVKVNGLDNIKVGESYIIIANHESAVDVFLLLGKIPVPMRMVAKEELKKTFILGTAMKRTGFIFVDNKRKGHSIDHLNKAFDRLKKEGLSLMIFPEGSRFKDELLSPFRPGAFVMAIQNDLPILPVVLKGPREMLPPHKKLFRKSDINIDILPPVDTRAYTYEDRRKLMRECHNLIHEHLKIMHDE
ncbi:MAG: lysophospholipid acyltransferase family protein [Candidatus Marinimicrobia bacterium]|nr:lysophospholipid acyltransferase family protein [Candidatus Neomarinimicrobiota bacterium]